MRYLLKYLQRAGFMSTLLIGGVLGGLLAPLSSQAGTPTLTLQIDAQTTLQRTTNAAGTTFENVPNNSILGAKLSACSAADRGLGYTDCYAIVTSTTVAYRTAITQANPTTRLYRIQNAIGATARLRVGDNLGQDNFSLVGVQFVPVNTANQVATTVTNWTTAAANTNEQHVLKITMQNKFDAPVNVNNATGVVVGGTTIGQVAFGMASGGEFRSAPLSTPVPTTTLFCTTSTGAAARCNTVGDNVTLTGTGIFRGTTAVPILSPGAQTAPNSNPLTLTVGAGNANDSTVGYAGLTNATMGQVNPTYPKFDCIDAAAPTKCQPNITLTLTATLKGPDTFVVLNGKNAFCAHCNFAQDNNRLTRLFTLLANVIAFLDWWESTHADNPPLRAFITEAQAFLAGFNGPPADPNCAGATYVQSSLLFESAKNQLTIAGGGGAAVDPAPATGTITIVKNLNPSCEINCDNSTFNFRITNQSTEVETTHSIVTSGTGSTVVTLPIGAYNVVELSQESWTLTASSCNGGNTNGVTVLAGGNVTCNFTNAPATSNDLGIRLTWGTQPFDLDSHLYIPIPEPIEMPQLNHVYFSAQGSLVASPYADLDIDDLVSFGPENITVVRLRRGGTYKYFVHNWSGTFNPGMTGSPARVELIRNGTTTTYHPPSGEETNRYWHVFNVIVSETCAVSIQPGDGWLTSPPMLPTPVTIGEDPWCPDN